MIVTKVKKNFNVAINCKINLQGNLQNHNLFNRLIKENNYVNNRLIMIRGTKYSELNSFR